MRSEMKRSLLNKDLQCQAEFIVEDKVSEHNFSKQIINVLYSFVIKLQY